MRPAPRKVLVMELAGLGDNVHLIPALAALHRHWPHAEVHVMANAHVASLFTLTPWIGRVWAYPNAPRPGLRGNLAFVGRLRRERFDVVINTNGSDRSSLITWASGARQRIGRRPADGGPPGWGLLFTRTIAQAHYEEPMYWQKWRFMRAALAEFAGDGPGMEPAFQVALDPGLRRAAGIAAHDERRYLHVSPFTTAAARELPLAQTADLIDRLRGNAPDLRLVLSCAAGERETAGMDALLRLLREPPWKVFRGTLDVPALAAVIETAALAFSGDTGSLHLALMTGTPAIAWFRAHRGQREWMPQGPRYRVLVAEGGEPGALHGISTDALLAAACELLSDRRP